MFDNVKYMIEEFNENGVSGLRLTDPENDKKALRKFKESLEKELSYVDRIENLKSKNRRLRKSLYAAVSISIVELLLLLAAI